MYRITTLRRQKDGTCAYRRYEMSELVEMLTAKKFKNTINDFRSCYPLLLRESPSLRTSVINQQLYGIPEICFSTEKCRKGGEEVVFGYNPLLMLTVSNLRNESIASDVRNSAAYRNHIEQHKRYASFIGTTNNQHPLNDPTGSRRFICVKVKGTIDFTTPVDYAQLYAQLRDEVLQGERYWFTKEEADRITEQNVPFQRTINLQSMLRALYRQPRPDETPESVTVPDIIDELLVRYPSLELSHDANIQVGMAMKSLGFTKMRTNSQRTYHLIRVTTCPARKTTP